ncbi:MAG: radical SAM protein [Thermoplasmata archaeon]|nr:MAG: radical SAM protein [Thermoplasmata archaeon]
MRCELCGKSIGWRSIPICPECARKHGMEYYEKIHNVPAPVHDNGKSPDCTLCSNRCHFGNDGHGLCGLRGRRNGELYALCSSTTAILHYYYDPLPTNCCNSWFCNGSSLVGKNLAIFYYGCNFDCLFCQNWEHKRVEKGPRVGIYDLVMAAMKKDVRCVCHFGGSPEPQLPFALNLSRRIVEERQDIMICWEWNGAGRKDLVLKAAEVSAISEGTVKFDLKAWNNGIHHVLTGRSNKPVHENFEAIGERYPEVLSATTLLVPYFVDECEVKAIAEFIASIDENIPYSLLVFHPDYRMTDFPITPMEQVVRCYRAAKKHLKRVNIGNKFLLTS